MSIGGKIQQSFKGTVLTPPPPKHFQKTAGGIFVPKAKSKPKKKLNLKKPTPAAQTSSPKQIILPPGANLPRKLKKVFDNKLERQTPQYLIDLASKRLKQGNQQDDQRRNRPQSFRYLNPKDLKILRKKILPSWETRGLSQHFPPEYSYIYDQATEMVNLAIGSLIKNGKTDYTYTRINGKALMEFLPSRYSGSAELGHLKQQLLSSLNFGEEILAKKITIENASTPKEKLMALTMVDEEFKPSNFGIVATLSAGNHDYAKYPIKYLFFKIRHGFWLDNGNKFRDAIDGDAIRIANMTVIPNYRHNKLKKLGLAGDPALFFDCVNQWRPDKDTNEAIQAREAELANFFFDLFNTNLDKAGHLRTIDRILNIANTAMTADLKLMPLLDYLTAEEVLRKTLKQESELIKKLDQYIDKHDLFFYEGKAFHPDVGNLNVLTLSKRGEEQLEHKAAIINLDPNTNSIRKFKRIKSFFVKFTNSVYSPEPRITQVVAFDQDGKKAEVPTGDPHKADKDIIRALFKFNQTLSIR